MSYKAPTVGTVVDDDNSTGITVSPPSGTTEGRLLTLFVAARPSGGILSWNTPSGWTKLASKTYSTYEELVLFGKIGAASESSVSVTATGTAALCQGVMASFPGAPASITGIVDSVSYSDDADYYSAHADLPTRALSAPGQANCLILWFGAVNHLDLGTSCTVPSGSTTLFQDTYDGTYNDMGIYGAYAIQTAAASVSASSWDSASATTGRSYSLVVALKAGSLKYLKLLAHSGAASATDVEGVVLNAARDTVIGEFTGQAFEAALEGSPGEAVLLIDVADITPDGNTLTTSDTPIVFAYNATYGTVGEGSATVVEV